MEQRESGGLQADPVGELSVTCLVNAGRWADVDRFVQQHPGCARSPHAALGRGVALLHLGKWDQALSLLLKACGEHPAHTPLKSLTLQALMARATERIQARDWAQAGQALNAVFQLEPQHAEAMHLMTSVQGAAPVEDLLAGERAKTAAAWEQEFVRERRTETAHHLALLYYWWGLEESRRGKIEAASFWQKSIGCWAYVLHEEDYWKEWLTRKRPAYEPDPAMMAGLPGSVRKEFLDRIEEITEQESSELVRFAEDLAMDCWAEFEIAALLKAGGNRPACGPLMMDLVGCPEPLQTPPHAVSDRGLRLGEFDIPFLQDTQGLAALYRGGYIRALAYLANGKLDRAETLILKRQKMNLERGIQEECADEMLAFLRMQRAQQRYIQLKCPPEDCSLEVLQEYAGQIRALLDVLLQARPGIKAPANRQALLHAAELFCRRIYNEFSAFEADTGNRRQFTEAGVELLHKAMSLADGIQDIEEARLHLATLVNRLALQPAAGEGHDRVITLFDWAVRLAPDNPIYKRNLAFSYYNRYSERRYSDMNGARDDIEKAYQLAPYDEDIRAGYQQMHGFGPRRTDEEKR